MAEAQALVRVCDEHLGSIVITALHTGMRRGEILNLKWDNVDIVHGFISLTETKNGERREVPINGTVRESLSKPSRRIVERMDKKNLSPISSMTQVTLKPYASVKRSFGTALKCPKH